jgi:hypothetical protein
MSDTEHALGTGEIVEHHDAIIRRLDRPPIVMGHALGGAVAEILLDRGLGAAGVVIEGDLRDLRQPGPRAPAAHRRRNRSATSSHAGPTIMCLTQILDETPGG